MSSGKRRAVDASTGSGSRPPLQPPTGSNPFTSSSGQHQFIPLTGQHPFTSSSGQHPFTSSHGQHPFQPQSASSRPSGLSISALLNPDPSDQPDTSRSVDNFPASSGTPMQDEPACNEGATRGVEASIEEASGSRAALDEFECPICGAYLHSKSSRSSTRNFRGHIRTCHTKTTHGGASNNPKTIYACGYCCAVFTRSENWVNHIVPQCKVSQGWLVSKRMGKSLTRTTWSRRGVLH
jgi:hypothetical protein